MRTLLWTLATALIVSGSATAALAQEEGDAELPEASEPPAKTPLEQQHDEEGTDLGSSPAPVAEAAPEEPAASGPAKPVSVGLLLGYGLSFESGKNPWGFGFGLRGGYNFDNVYLGARFAYYLGESQKEMVFGGGESTASLNIWELGIEAGYDVHASDKFVVRPELGLGVASLNVSLDVPGALVTNTSSAKGFFYIAPGVAALFDVSPSVFLGIDARVMIITSTADSIGKSTLKGLMLFANGGMHF